MTFDVRAADFGRMVTEVDVDLAVIKTLRRWLPTYLAQAERERELRNRTLARPKPESYGNTLEDEEFADHRMPAVIVTTAQTTGDPAVDGDGRYYAAWRVVVSAVVRGRTPPETRAVAALFGACVRRVLVQHQSLGGFAGELKWTGGKVAPVADPTDGGRFLAGGINEFTVYVDDVVQAGVGPATPDPYADPDPENTPDEPYDPLAVVTRVTDPEIVGLPITTEPGS